MIREAPISAHQCLAVLISAHQCSSAPLLISAHQCSSVLARVSTQRAHRLELLMREAIRGPRCDEGGNQRAHRLELLDSRARRTVPVGR